MSDILVSPVNRLLAALPSAEYQRLAPYLSMVSLPVGHILYEPNEVIKEVYFPSQTMISLISLVTNNSKAEIALVGNEGMVGLPVILGGDFMPFLVMVQIADSALKLDAQVLKDEFNRGEALQRLLLLYIQAYLTQIAQSAACATSHNLEQRLARWLLSIRDCIQQDELRLTQQLLSQLLGVRRATITEAAGALQKENIIRYRRGVITIVNLKALESKACGCYFLIKQEFIRLLRKKI